MNNYTPLSIQKNLEKLNKFLELRNLPRMNHEEIESLNRPITSVEIESVNKTFLERKSQVPTASSVNSTKPLRINTNPSQTLPNH